MEGHCLSFCSQMGALLWGASRWHHLVIILIMYFPGQQCVFFSNVSWNEVSQKTTLKHCEKGKLHIFIDVAETIWLPDLSPCPVHQVDSFLIFLFSMGWVQFIDRLFGRTFQIPVGGGHYSTIMPTHWGIKLKGGGKLPWQSTRKCMEPFQSRSSVVKCACFHRWGKR